MKKISNPNEFKVGDKIMVLTKPSIWSSQLHHKCPLITDEVTFPYILTVQKVDQYYNMTCGNYGWDLIHLIKAGSIKIEGNNSFFTFIDLAVTVDDLKDFSNQIVSGLEVEVDSSFSSKKELLTLIGENENNYQLIPESVLEEKDIDFDILDDEHIFYLESVGYNWDEGNCYAFTGSDPFTENVRFLDLNLKYRGKNKICDTHQVKKLRYATTEEIKKFCSSWAENPNFYQNVPKKGGLVLVKEDFKWMLKVATGKLIASNIQVYDFNKKFNLSVPYYRLYKNYKLIKN